MSEGLKDAPIADYQRDLLDLAFRAVSGMPLNPHVKNRSRGQDSVVAASLELGQAKRAFGYAEQIANWRRGAGYASVALYCAQHGIPEATPALLDRASEVADAHMKDPDSQEWRRDRIRVIIARTHLLLGHFEQANEFAAGISDSEVGAIEATRAALIKPEAFDDQLKRLDAVIQIGNFDQVKGALEACAQMFNVFYTDSARRAQVGTRVRTSYAKLPAELRIDLLMQLASYALEHQDSATALEMVNATQTLVDGVRWLPQDRVPLVARIAALRFRAGDRDRATKDVADAVALFDAEGTRIVDIYRAGTLRPVAEAYQAMGQLVPALKMYGRVVEEGVKNLNSKPRAEDLCATCLSMALHAVEPGNTLRTRLVQVCDELKEPW